MAKPRRNWAIKNPVKTITFTSIVLFLAIDYLATTILTRESAKRRIASNIYHHGLSENFSVTQKWGYDKYQLTTNSLEFKGYPSKKVILNSEKYKILFTGDYFTGGVGLTYEKTFPGIIASELEGNIDILNTGVASYSPKLYYLKTKHLIDKGRASI